MHRSTSGTARRRTRGGAPGEGDRSACRGRVAGAALLVLLLAVPAAAMGGEGPELRLRPPAQPAPQAEAQDEREDAAEARRAFEAERREDWRAWQLERGGAWREWLRGRREAERTFREESRENRLERRKPRRGAQDERLGERLGEQWRRQRDLRDDRLGDRAPGGPELPGLGRRLGSPGRSTVGTVRPLRR